MSVWLLAQDSRSAHGLLYLAAYGTIGVDKNTVKSVIGVRPSAWELVRHALRTRPLQVRCHLRVPVSDRRAPVPTPMSGTQRARGKYITHLFRTAEIESLRYIAVTILSSTVTATLVQHDKMLVIAERLS